MVLVRSMYRAPATDAPASCVSMQQLQLTRQRNGAYDWSSLARNIAVPEIWTERYRCPNWHDSAGTRFPRRPWRGSCLPDDRVAGALRCMRRER